MTTIFLWQGIRGDARAALRGAEHLAARAAPPRPCPRRPGARAPGGRRSAHRGRDVRPRDLELVRAVPPADRDDGPAVRCGRAARAAGGGLADPTMPEMTHAAVARFARGAARDALRVGRRRPRAGRRFDGLEVGPNEWLVRGVVPRRLRALPRLLPLGRPGLYANIPQLFGMRAEVEKDACACDGAPAASTASAGSRRRRPRPTRTSSRASRC